MKGRLEGDSGLLKLGSVGGPVTLGNLLGGRASGVRAKSVTLYTPGAGDQGLTANTVTIMVGPNRTPSFPMPPGSAVVLENVDPMLVAFDSLGNSSQLVYYVYGGECEQDSLKE